MAAIPLIMAAPAATEAATKLAPLAGHAAEKVSRVTLSFVEKMAIAGVIVICIILLIVGTSLLLNSHWKSGLVVTGLGIGGMYGCYVWANHSTVASAFGQGEEDTYFGGSADGGCGCSAECSCHGGYGGRSQSDLGEDFQEIDEEIDIQPATATATSGSHEKTLLHDLKKLAKVLRKTSDKGSDKTAKSLKKIHNSIEKEGSQAEARLHKVAELVDKILSHKDELTMAYQALTEPHRQELISIIQNMKKLSGEVGVQSQAIEDKLNELLLATKGSTESE
jgi:hypothetical protein